jgi:hypothetical protein
MGADRVPAHRCDSVRIPFGTIASYSPLRTASLCLEQEPGSTVPPNLSLHLTSSPEGFAAQTLVNLLECIVFLASHLNGFVSLVLFLASRKPHCFLDAEVSASSPVWARYRPGFIV